MMNVLRPRMYVVSIVALSFFHSSGFAQSKQCGWFAVLFCSKSEAAAIRKQESDAPGQIINTSDLSGFRRGYYCIINGPMKRAEAQGYIKQFTPHIKDAYVKRGCGDFNRLFPD
jgi:hypothetical protein